MRPPARRPQASPRPGGPAAPGPGEGCGPGSRHLGFARGLRPHGRSGEKVLRSPGGRGTGWPRRGTAGPSWGCRARRLPGGSRLCPGLSPPTYFPGVEGSSPAPAPHPGRLASPAPRSPVDTHCPEEFSTLSAQEESRFPIFTVPTDARGKGSQAKPCVLKPP